jgi:hypothetical protein
MNDLEAPEFGYLTGWGGWQMIWAKEAQRKK